MRRFIPLLGICLIAAGCVNAASSPTPTPPAGPTAGPTATPAATPKYAVASSADKLILRIQTSGGFIAPGFLLTTVPSFALYGDGSIIVPGPIDAIYPAPLLPNLRVMRVSAADIQKIVAAADAAGLLGPDGSFDAVGIADAGTTEFTTVVAGKAHRISAYALSEAKGPGAPTSGDPVIAAARARLSAFWAEMTDLTTFLGRPVDDTEAYKPAGLRLFLSDAGPADSTQPTAQTLAWPLATDPATAAQQTTVPGTMCVALAGSDLASFTAAAANANGATVWTYGHARYSVGVRPMYPNESGCAGGSL
jgi:hypothetical protein